MTDTESSEVAVATDAPVEETPVAAPVEAEAAVEAAPPKRERKRRRFGDQSGEAEGSRRSAVVWPRHIRLYHPPYGHVIASESLLCLLFFSRSFRSPLRFLASHITVIL